MRLKQLLMVEKISATPEKYDLVSITGGVDTFAAITGLDAEAVTGFLYSVVFQNSLLTVLSSAHAEAESKINAIPNIFLIAQASFLIKPRRQTKPGTVVTSFFFNARRPGDGCSHIKSSLSAVSRTKSSTFVKSIIV